MKTQTPSTGPNRLYCPQWANRSYAPFHNKSKEILCLLHAIKSKHYIGVANINIGPHSNITNNFSRQVALTNNINMAKFCNIC